MGIALIISLNFNPGHVSHMIASYKQCEELGYKPIMYVDEKFKNFIPESYTCAIYGKERPKKSDLAIFLFPSLKNPMVIRHLKKKGSKIIYIFHEPLAAYSVYRKAGFSKMKMLKLRIINWVNALTVKWSDIILLPSEKAVTFYDNNKLYKNKNRHYLPLMYDDERDEKTMKSSREFISYIGTIAPDHSFNEFLKFVQYAIGLNLFPNLKFLIATKSCIEWSNEMSRLKETGRLVVHEGSPMSDEEINCFYASSLIVWNAYTRTTQSGVLAKAFMFGTPVIVLKRNLAEFINNGEEVVAIDDNKSLNQIEAAINKIVDNHLTFSTACRNRFISTFYYRNYNHKLVEIINSCK